MDETAVSMSLLQVPTRVATTAIQTDRVRCRICQHGRNRQECAGGERSGYTCVRCLEWHFHALDVLGGAVPQGCQECGLDWEAEKKRAINGEVRMYAVPKDGIYQLLCAGCSKKYVHKRPDMYGDSEFGKRLKLK